MVQALVCSCLPDLTTHANSPGTTGATPSYPDEQIGYLASEQYSSQSQPSTPYALNKTLTNTSQPVIESPLRKASIPAIDADPVIGVRSKRALSQQSDEAMDSSTENSIHVNDPQRRYNKITGGEETIDETQAPRPYIQDDEDNGYSVPILAADEVAKGGDFDFMQPAVSPRLDRRSSHEPGSGDHTPSHSRPSSRPGSIYGLHSASHSLSRFISHHDERDNMHTPLEDVDEYEPLFPDEESKQKALSHAERFKRPEALKHRFPSQDIWEDAPNSVMYQATVSTPDLPQQTEPKASAVYEPPEAEAAGKGETPQMTRDDFLTRSRPHLKAEMGRPGMQPRFPSQDIWEDSPESYHLVTTVSNNPAEDSKPVVPPRPAKTKVSELASSSQAAPSIPPRPSKTVQSVPPVDAKLSDVGPSHKQPSPTELRKVPSIPDRPKPQVPPRPAKKPSGESLTKVTSQGSADSNETEKAGPVTSPPLTKAKPQVPSRPGQSKLSNLKGNFMSDLNQKLGLGPPKEKEKEPEPEVEAKPLEDARKGRARGPQRRAPAKSPAATPAPSPAAFSMCKPTSLWNIDDGGLLVVGTGEDLQDTARAEDTKVEADEPPVTLSSQKVEQLDHATIADTPLPPTIDTESKPEDDEQKQSEDASESTAPLIPTNSAGDFPDPTLGTPDLEKSNPLSNFTTATTVPDESLSQPSTDSSHGLAKNPIEREVADAATDAIPASKQTTATEAASGDSLERFKPTPAQVLNPTGEKIAEEEPVELRNEQVAASAPATSVASTSSASSGVADTPAKVAADEKANGSDAPKEPMPEQDVTYKQLEEMQSRADGKVKSDGDMGPTKVVE